jgi:MFS transporter, DHA1 family, multidrug resistance protein
VAGDARPIKATAAADADESIEPWQADWRRLTAVFVIVSFFETVGFGHFFAFLPLLVQQLGVSHDQAATTVGLLSTLSLLIGLPLVPFWGAWADRYSRKAVVVRSAIVEALLFAALGVAGSIGAVFLIAPLAGLNLGNTGVMLAELTDRVPRRHLGFAMSLVGAATPLGISLGPGFGGWIADTIGVQALFIFDAFLALMACLLLIVFYHERADRPRTNLTVLQLIRRSLTAVVRTPVARAVFTASFLLLLGQRTIFPFMALWVQELNGPIMLATVVGLVAGAYGIAASIGSPLAGRLADRIGYQRVILAAAIGTVICFGIAAMVTALLPFTITYAAYGICYVTVSSLLFVILATRLPTDVRSSVLNLALAPLYISGILGSLISTQLLIRTGGEIRPLWYLGAAVNIVLVFAVLNVRRATDRTVAPASDGAGPDERGADLGEAAAESSLPGAVP